MVRGRAVLYYAQLRWHDAGVPDLNSNDPTFGPWIRLARLVREAREELGLSKRAAAAEAGVSEGWWRQLELGFRTPAPGVHLPLNATPTTLRKAIAVLTAYPSDALVEALEEVTGQPWSKGSPGRPLPAALTGKLSELTPDQYAKLEAYIDGLLDGRS